MLNVLGLVFTIALVVRALCLSVSPLSLAQTVPVQPMGTEMDGSILLSLSLFGYEISKVLLNCFVLFSGERVASKTVLHLCSFDGVFDWCAVCGCAF